MRKTLKTLTFLLVLAICFVPSARAGIYGELGISYDVNAMLGHYENDLSAAKKDISHFDSALDSVRGNFYTKSGAYKNNDDYGHGDSADDDDYGYGHGDSDDDYDYGDSDDDYNATIAPEPVSSTLFIVGGAAMGFRRFKKRTSLKV